MDIISTFAVIAGIIFIGFLSELIFKHTNIPDVLILIIVGITIGNYLKWATPETFGQGASLFATFALIFILFQGALNIEFKTLLKSLSSAFTLTMLSFTLTVGVVTGITYLMGYSPVLALLIGFIIGGTSSAVVIPIVENVEIRNKYGLVLTLESAISDVLCIIGTITILEIIQTGEFIASGVFKTVLSSFSLALVVGVIFGLIWIILLRKFEVLKNAYMLSVALIVALYAFVESAYVEASGAIAVFAFALMLGNSKSILNGKNKEVEEHKKSDEPQSKTVRNVYTSSAKNFFAEISFFVKTFFFVYLGIIMDFSNPLIFAYAAVLTLGVYLIRPFAVRLVFGREEMENKERALLETLIPKGLAAAVLAQIAVTAGVFGELAGQFVSLILATVLLSILFTSILVFLAEKGMFRSLLPFLIPKEKKN